MSQLQQALKVLAEAMRPDDEELHVNARRRGLHDELPDAEREDEDTERDGLRPMGYFSEKPSKVTQRRASNVGAGPLTMQPVLLAKPNKKEVRK